MSQSKRILVVDDARIVHRMYDAMLPGHVLSHAYNGREALELLGREGSFDLILLDVNMPEMGGLEFLRLVKAGPQASIPVVMVSTEGDEEQVARGLQAGASEYLRKPFGAPAITEILQRLSSR
jgi:CheY-like chemotaxis protein